MSDLKRAYNFNPGPGALPLEVLQQAQAELLDFKGTGMSVMEISHRSKEFEAVIQTAEADLRELLGIPSNYKIMFLQGGATLQFAMLAMNLRPAGASADYIVTGTWSKTAIKEAKKLGAARAAANTEADGFNCTPASLDLDPKAAYLHFTSNETIHGVEFSVLPDSKGLTLVSDMSSNILSRKIDVSQYGLIYAGTQKNMGPAGVTLVIIRDDLIGHAGKATPPVFNYAEQAKNQSMLNTPATYNWYLVGLVLKWLKGQGGVDAIEERNIAKAAKLYQAIDQSALYSNPVALPFRSRMNVPFILADASLDKPFLVAAEANGLFELKGHRSVGGMRASIYNAMPEAGVLALIDFMTEFERTH